MEHNPSWETNSSWTIQKILPVLWSPKVQYCINKREPLVPILSQKNSVNASPSSWTSILILTYHLRVGIPNGHSVRYPHQNPVRTSILPYVPHAPPPRLIIFVQY